MREEGIPPNLAESPITPLRQAQQADGTLQDSLASLAGLTTYVAAAHPWATPRRFRSRIRFLSIACQDGAHPERGRKPFPSKQA